MQNQIWNTGSRTRFALIISVVSVGIKREQDFQDTKWNRKSLKMSIKRGENSISKISGGSLSASPMILTCRTPYREVISRVFRHDTKRKNMSNRNNSKRRQGNYHRLPSKLQKLPRKRQKPFTYVKRQFGNYKPLDWQISNQYKLSFLMP